MISIKERLQAAAEMVERVGLHKGDFWPGAQDNRGRGPYRDGDPISMAGALHLLYGLSESLGASVWLGTQIGEPSIQRWTDRPEVTTEEVVATVRRVSA